MTTAEKQRRVRHLHGAPLRTIDATAPDEVICGACDRSWCYTCHPTPAYLCPFCNGDDDGVRYSRATIKLR